MFSVKLDHTIYQIIDSFYRLGLWQREDEPTIRKTATKWLFSTYPLLLPISLIAGATSSQSTDNRLEDRLFLAETAIMTIVMSVKLFYIIWRKSEMLEVLNRMGNYSVRNANESERVNGKLKSFMNFMKVFFLCSILIAVCALILVPFVSSERKLFFNIGFPLDWRNSEFAYWMAFTFILTQVVFSAISVLFSIIMWYMLLNCYLRFDVLGNELRNLGTIDEVVEVDVAGRRRRKISELEKQHAFSTDFIAANQSYQDIIDSTKQLESYLWFMLSVQLLTSSFCICGSIYCLAYNQTENLMESAIYVLILLYNIFDIFMISYLANEITLSSERLLHCLFESDWTDKTCKKSMLIFGERLRQPVQLVILILYPLTLELFTTILDSAYKMFNILQTLAV